MKPPRLQLGDTIGVVSPSWGAAGLFPHRLERGVAALRDMGFSVRLGAHALDADSWVSSSAQHRAEDINDMVRDESIRMVLAAIGGDHSCQLLPHLDFAAIASQPKVFMGYSDITVLNIAIWARTGLTTFNGPALITDFAEYPEMLSYSRRSFERSVMSAAPVGLVEPAIGWTDETLDWSRKLDLTRPRKMQRSTGWRCVRGGAAEGVLVGGCIESLQHLRGTPYWPDLSGAILFIETSEAAPSPAEVDGVLSDYENMGVFDRLNGMLVGRPMRYSDPDRELLLEVVRERTEHCGFPVIGEMDFGHTCPQMVMPIGCRVTMNADRRQVSIEEGAVV